MSTKTPGQAAFEARVDAKAARLIPAVRSAVERWAWDRLSDAERADEEAAAQAAIDAARVPSVAINLSFDGEVTEERAEEIRKALAAAIEPGQFRDRLAAAMAARDEYRDNAILHIRERDEARAQLAAADRATAEFRRQCSELAGELGATHAVLAEILPRFLANGHGSLSAIAGPGEVAEWRQRAGIEDGQ